MAITTIFATAPTPATGRFPEVSISVVSGILSGVISGTILGILVWVWQWWVRRTNTEVFKLELRVSSRMQGPEFRFGVIHARNDDGTIINRVHWFKKGRRGRWHAAIRHPRHVGFQYKCFVDHGLSCRPEEIIKWLAEEGYKTPSLSKGKPNRIWFILPEKPTAVDPAGFVNNQYYPE